jgi:RNA polymerase-binding transcription factor DksA
MKFTAEFLANQKQWLEARLESKTQILKEGGERALSHSTNDLIRIRFALRRIADDQYGLCTDCGCLIEDERLGQIPETPFCASCAQSIEAKNARARN